MAITRGSVFQIKQTKDYVIVRAVNDNGRLCVKSIADDTLSRSYAEDDLVPASGTDVPWFKLRTLHINGSDLFCWEMPSGETICESDAVGFCSGYASSPRFSQA
jgi:hypothetical protein